MLTLCFFGTLFIILKSRLFPQNTCCVCARRYCGCSLEITSVAPVVFFTVKTTVLMACRVKFRRQIRPGYPVFTTGCQLNPAGEYSFKPLSCGFVQTHSIEEKIPTSFSYCPNFLYISCQWTQSLPFSQETCLFMTVIEEYASVLSSLLLFADLCPFSVIVYFWLYDEWPLC